MPHTLLEVRCEQLSHPIKFPKMMARILIGGSSSTTSSSPSSASASPVPILL